MDTLYSEIMISSAYAGLNAGLSVKPTSGFSIFTKADTVLVYHGPGGAGDYAQWPVNESWYKP